MEENNKKIIGVYKGIYEDNDKLAARIDEELRKKKISSFNILGTPGCGKTTFLTSAIRHIPDKRTLVVEGDVESDIDTVKLKELGIEAVQINTHGGCHLDALMIEKILSTIDDKELDIIFIENVGNLICPAEFNIGEKKRIVISSVTEGSDKPYKYPRIFETADAVVINKSDLIPFVNFDEEFFTKGVRMLNKRAPIFKLSSLKDEGFDEFTSWLLKAAEE